MLPAHFTLCGIDYETRIVPPEEWHLYDPKQDNQGLLFTDKGLICIRGDMGIQQQQQTWAHEIIHLLYDTIGHPLNNDEAHVDIMASLLHQILTTMGVSEAKPRRKRK